jgi:hypothetical protein
VIIEEQEPSIQKRRETEMNTRLFFQKSTLFFRKISFVNHTHHASHTLFRSKIIRSIAGRLSMVFHSTCGWISLIPLSRPTLAPVYLETTIDDGEFSDEVPYSNRFPRGPPQSID